MSISEEVRQRVESGAADDRWWKERFRELMKSQNGSNHIINRCFAEQQDQFAAIQQLRQQVADLERERAELTERVDRMAEFLTTLKKNGGA